ncbi:unnamed protein product [Cunninghamella blakesleeana]
MSGQNYIGSKISLISLSDIRYVGTLHSINTNDSTVSLENVRSFGTEGRRGSADDEVPASDTVFDFVVFRGSDIKDLQVFEAPSKPAPPPPQQHAQGMVDPAISHSVKGYPPMNPYMMPNYPPHQAMYWQTPMYPGQQMPLGQPPMPSSNQQPPQPSNISPSSSVPVLPANMPQPVPTPSNNATTTNDTPSSQPQQQSSTATTNATTAVINNLTEQLNQDEIDGAAVENLAKQVSELDIDTAEPEENGSLPQQQTQQQQSSHQRQNNNYRGTRNNNNNNNNNNNSNNYRQNSSGHTNGTRNQTGKQQQRINIPQSDFDFESSNAKFSKNELLKELMGGSKEEVETNNTNTEINEETVIIPPSDEEFYDKNKSFFDNISCESKERQDQEANTDRRGKFHEERRLNMETFGQASVDQTRYRNFRGRGGHRGGYRGNRGGNNNYRGGNRHHNQNNRNNYGYRPQHQPQQQQQQQVESQ